MRMDLRNLLSLTKSLTITRFSIRDLLLLNFLPSIAIASLLSFVPPWNLLTFVFLLPPYLAGLNFRYCFYTSTRNFLPSFLCIIGAIFISFLIGYIGWAIRSNSLFTPDSKTLLLLKHALVWSYSWTTVCSLVAHLALKPKQP